MIGVIALAGIGGGWWYYSSSMSKLPTSVTKTSDSVVVNDSAVKETAVLSTEQLQSILSSLVGYIDNDEILSKKSKFFTERYMTIFKKACEKADRDGCEYPKIWWQYSDDDPEEFNIDELKMISDNEALAKVKLSSELYIGCYEITLKNDDKVWLIDRINKLSSENNPKFDDGRRIQNTYIVF